MSLLQSSIIPTHPFGPLSLARHDTRRFARDRSRSVDSDVFLELDLMCFVVWLFYLRYHEIGSGACGDPLSWL